MNDETTTSALAQSALGLPRSGMTEGQLADMLAQEFATRRAMGHQSRDQGGVLASRIHFGMAAICADILSRYYQSTNQEAAERWTKRAKLNNDRAFGRRNMIGENIGAKMT